MVRGRFPQSPSKSNTAFMRESRQKARSGKSSLLIRRSKRCSSSPNERVLMWSKSRENRTQQKTPGNGQSSMRSLRKSAKANSMPSLRGHQIVFQEMPETWGGSWGCWTKLEPFSCKENRLFHTALLFNLSTSSSQVFMSFLKSANSFLDLLPLNFSALVIKLSKRRFLYRHLVATR